MMNVNEQGTNNTKQIIPKTDKKSKEEIKNCPACYLLAVQTQLKLYQINMNEAVYLCPNYQTCLYPHAHGWCYVKRTIDEMVSDIESDDDAEEHPDSNIQDEIENLIKKMQSEFTRKKDDNIILNSIVSPTENKKETSMSMLVNEMESRLAYIEEKVIENINENNQILIETENKSTSMIDNALLEDLDHILNEFNEIEASPPEKMN